MTRRANAMRDVAMRAQVIGLGVVLAACSAGSSGGGGFQGSAVGQGANETSSSGGTATASSSGNGSSGGSTASSGAGAGSSGGTQGSSGSSSGATSGTSSGGAKDAGSGTTADGIPTAPGITVGPVGATDLAAPSASRGIQFETPDMAYAVAPGQEIFPNYCITLPNTIEIGGFQSWMSPGSSHHFILYRGDVVPAGAACMTGSHTWMYATSTPGQVVTENMPPNVGLEVAQSTQLILNMHFINPGTKTMYPKIKVNLLFAQDVKYQAGTMVSFNNSINIPPATAAGPGTQTVSGVCTAPVGANFFQISTHTHMHGTQAWVEFVRNGTTTEIVHTGTTTAYPADQEPGTGTDWQHPGVGLWTTPNFLTVQAGDSFPYHCSYSNSGSSAVTVGQTAASNEMCMEVGYYFPAGKTSCN